METISLHNIRKGLRWRGGELWIVSDRGEELVGSVVQSEDGKRWLLETPNYMVVQFKDEATPRLLLEGIGRVLAKEFTKLTQFRRRYGETIKNIEESEVYYFR